MITAYAALEPGSELKPFEYDPGELDQDDIEIDVLYCGICHSDLSVIDNSWQMTQYPVVPGHEVIGKVAQVGKNVGKFKIGEIVGLGWNSAFCNECANCGSGNNNLCINAPHATIIGHHGGFANKVRAAKNSVVKIPELIDLDSIAPLLCGGITVFNPLLQFGIKPTSQVAVIGIGGLGHMALQFLNAWGCEVTAFSSNESKYEEILNLGAHHVLNSTKQNEIKSVEGKFDYIISTVNVKLDWNMYLSTLAAKGRLHFVGAVLEPLDINVFSLITQQRTVSGSPVGSPYAISEMLEFVKLHKVKPVVEIFPMSEVNNAISKLRKGDVRYRVVLKN